MVASASHARSLAQVLEKWAPIFRSWGTGCGGRRHARARHAAPDQAERDTTPHGSFSALDLEAAACCVTVLAGAAAWQHRIRDIKGRNRVDRWRSFPFGSFGPKLRVVVSSMTTTSTSSAVPRPSACCASLPPIMVSMVWPIAVLAGMVVISSQAAAARTGSPCRFSPSRSNGTSTKAKAVKAADTKSAAPACYGTG